MPFVVCLFTDSHIYLRWLNTVLSILKSRGTKVCQLLVITDHKLIPGTNEICTVRLRNVLIIQGRYHGKRVLLIYPSNSSFSQFVRKLIDRFLF